MHTIHKHDKIDDIKFILEAVIIGIIAGLVSVLYKYLLHAIIDFIMYIQPIVRSNFWLVPVVFITLILLAVGVHYILKYEKFAGGSGIPQVEAEIKGYLDIKPVRLMFAKLVGGCLSALGGLSVGREGPSIQMGAMSGKIVSRILKRNRTTEKFLITCGAGAGIAAAFNAPVAGVLFTIEELHKHVSRKLLVTAITATVIADFVSKMISGTELVFRFKIASSIPLNKYWVILLLGILLGLLGVVYNLLVRFFTNFYQRLRIRKVFKLMFPFIISGILFLFLPEVLGGGSVLMGKLFASSMSLWFLLALFIVKLLFSVISFTSGVPGGIFFPILVLGALIGAIFAKGFSSDYIGLLVLLSMAGFLTAIVRAPITAIILIFEMTGNITFLLPLSMVCLLSYTVANYLNSLPIYEYLLENLFENNDIHLRDGEERVVVDFVVQPGSLIEGMLVRDMNLLHGSLVANIDRSLTNLIPRGDTEILTGDILHVVIHEEDLFEVSEEIGKLCMTKREKDR